MSNTVRHNMDEMHKSHKIHHQILQYEDLHLHPHQMNQELGQLPVYLEHAQSESHPY